ncbi:hypothetical protein Fmac_017406 [Flemingia macrophylla]|uniref:Protein kinase domain-containing protein n=1 Tax=Flemingia macrophylla TaxID=520843 RepID=A0ABD1M3W1_9FABA
MNEYNKEWEYRISQSETLRHRIRELDIAAPKNRAITLPRDTAAQIEIAVNTIRHENNQMQIRINKSEALTEASDITNPPYDHISIDCGSTSNSTTRDGRSWTAENTKLLSDNHQSVAATPLTPSTPETPYTSARLSYSQFNYSFPVTAGPKFLRLFFYSTTYPNFDTLKAKFSVKAGKFTLLQDFNASLNAEAGNDPGNQDILFREYCINVEDGDEKLNITFTPSTNRSYALINGIEIVSMPPYLYYTNISKVDTEWPQVVEGPPYSILNNSALETMYRLNVGEREISPSLDTGMLRRWNVDDDYLTSQSGPSVDYGRTTNLRFTLLTPNYTAPDEVYRTLRTMGTNGSTNMMSNLSWQLPVDSGFTYLLRLYFCELNPLIVRAGDLRFNIFIADQLATDWADVLVWTNNQKGVPVVKNYVVLFYPLNHKKPNLILKLNPYSETSRFKNAQLNAIELLKINNSNGSLAGPDPDSPPQTSVVSSPTSNSKSGNTTITLVAIAGAVSGALLLSFILAFFLIKRRNNVAVHKGSKQKDGTSRGSGSSLLPTNLCRHFSIEEIIAATNNFDELFVVGVGGFGNVYKGYVDDGSTRVAIKRLKRGSRQGMHEFLNEIEMLSQLRHLHLVSLIGSATRSMR